MIAKKETTRDQEQIKGKLKVGKLRNRKPITDLTDGEQRQIQGGAKTLRERQLELEKLLRDKEITQGEHQAMASME